MSEYHLIVVGGGPAGMMAAGRAAERGCRVLLLEAGPSLGRKLLITAGGRCNVTNTAPLPDFLEVFGRQGGFLRDALRVFGNTQLLAWLRARGIETVEERRGRVFPASQDARTILQALTDYMALGGIEVYCGKRAELLLIENGRLAGVAAAGKEWRGNCVLIATGGLSYPGTGSTGDGYRLALQAGHTIVETYPAVIAFETAEPWPKRLQGTPIKNVDIRATHNGKKLAGTFGEALWTHYGIAGPTILDISRNVVLAMRKGWKVALEMDLRPVDTVETLDKRLLDAVKKQGKKHIANVLAAWLPQRTAELVVELAGIAARKKMNQCSKSERSRIVRLIKCLELHLTGPRPIEEAIVTGGGVELKEVHSKTMESRLLKGLFFAGEVLDLAGPSGGYNLQAAFSTGHLAGQSAG